MVLVHFQGKPINITVIQVYAPTKDAEEAEADQFFKDLEDLLELTLKKDILFIIEDWNAKVGSQEVSEVAGKFCLRVKNETGQRLTEFSKECSGYSKHPFSTAQEMTLHMHVTKWSIPKSVCGSRSKPCME